MLITPTGGLAAIALFLQPGATAIVHNYWVVGRNMSEQLENIQAWNIEHVQCPALVSQWCLKLSAEQLLSASELQVLARSAGR